MNYFDRVLARSQSLPNTKQEVQLLALTCFYLAVKMHQAGPILSTQQMSMISGSEFSVKSVADMEQHVLLTLNWSLYPPCALEFVRPFLSILLKQNCIPSSVCHFEVVNEALDTLNAALLQDYFFIAHDLLPSHLALAALLVAVRAVHPYAFAIPSVQDAARIISSESGTQMSEEQVTLCYTRLWTIHDTERDRCWSNPTVACVPAGVPTCLSDHNRSTPVSPVGVTLGTFKAVKQFEIYVPSL